MDATEESNIPKPNYDYPRLSEISYPDEITGEYIYVKIDPQKSSLNLSQQKEFE